MYSDLKLNLPSTHKIICRLIKEVCGVKHIYVALQVQSLKGLRFVTYRVLDLGNEYQRIDGKAWRTEQQAIQDMQSRGLEKPKFHKRELANRFKKIEPQELTDTSFSGAMVEEYLSDFTLEAIEDLPTI